jgi:hypothetical protein
MLKLAVNEAIGQTLGHDITMIVPGTVKKRAFIKGHIIQPQDIAVLKNLGKEHIYVGEPDDTSVHEDQGALQLARMAAGPGTKFSVPSQGRVNLRAARDGLLKVQVEQLYRLNNIENVIFSTLHNNTSVVKDQMIGGTRIVPVAIDKHILEYAEGILNESVPMLSVKPYCPLWVGVITTGSEVNNGRIKDGFGKTIRLKIVPFGGRWMGQVIVPDEPELITATIRDFISEGADLVIVTGGMSVDADDATPCGIKASGAEVVFYGAPVLPGSQFMLAYQGRIPICGVPGGALFSRRTTLDILLPRIFAEDVITRKDIISLGHGGLCEECPVCRYPHCSFGKAGI